MQLGGYAVHKFPFRFLFSVRLFLQTYLIKGVQNLSICVFQDLETVLIKIVRNRNAEDDTDHDDDDSE